MYYPTAEFSNIEKVLKGIQNVFDRLKRISENNENLKLLEYHNMYDEGVISPGCYFTAKYKYKDIFIKTGTLIDCTNSHCCWCEISNYEEDVNISANICVMRIQGTEGFMYLWEPLCEYREEIERLIFPDIYEEYDKKVIKS